MKMPYKPYHPTNYAPAETSSQQLAKGKFPIQNPQSQQFTPEQALQKGTLFPDLFQSNQFRQSDGGETS